MVQAVYYGIIVSQCGNRPFIPTFMLTKGLPERVAFVYSWPFPNDLAVQTCFCFSQKGHFYIQSDRRLQPRKGNFALHVHVHLFSSSILIPFAFFRTVACRTFLFNCLIVSNTEMAPDSTISSGNMIQVSTIKTQVCSLVFNTYGRGNKF